MVMSLHCLVNATALYLVVGVLPEASKGDGLPVAVSNAASQTAIPIRPLYSKTAK